MLQSPLKLIQAITDVQFLIDDLVNALGNEHIIKRLQRIKIKLEEARQEIKQGRTELLQRLDEISEKMGMKEIKQKECFKCGGETAGKLIGDEMLTICGDCGMLNEGALEEKKMKEKPKEETNNTETIIYREGQSWDNGADFWT